MKITDLELFYRYAIPCGELGAELGVLDREKVEGARKAFLGGKPLERPEQCFPVAVKLLELTAERLGKSVIGPDVIRRYFWVFHEEHVREKAMLIPGFPIEECLVWPGRMLSDDKALTPAGERKIKKVLVPNLKQGELVTVHHGYACEKISEEEFERLWEERVDVHEE
jgi:hydrogenase maturation factor